MNRMTDPQRNSVDTHADIHVVVAVCSQSHQLLGCATFDTTPAGYVKLMSLGLLDAIGIEVDRPDRAARR